MSRMIDLKADADGMAISVAELEDICRPRPGEPADNRLFRTVIDLRSRVNAFQKKLSQLSELIRGRLDEVPTQPHENDHLGFELDCLSSDLADAWDELMEMEYAADIGLDELDRRQSDQ